MVQVNITRQNVEALADEGDVLDASRIDLQVAATTAHPSQVEITRQTLEVLAVEPNIPSAGRIDLQVAASNAHPTQVEITRQSIEVLARPDSTSAATGIYLQVAATSAHASQVAITRQSIECLARQGSAGPVTPLALVDDVYVFMHNWASRVTVTTSFRTDVQTSPDSGAEARRGLNVKPFRTMDLEWTVCDSDTVSGVNSLVELERLEVLLRRMTDQRFQVPIYPDQQELGADYLSTADTILIPTREGRFFVGARVAIVQLDHCNQPVSHTFHIIDDMTNDQLTFTATLGVNIAAGSFIFPVMDCEIMLDVEAAYSTARVPSIKMTVSEAPGASQLPPLKSDTPTGAQLAHDDRPVWFEEPDWSSPVVKGRKRSGSRTSEGRADFVNTEGDRSRQTHRFSIQGTRAEMWNCLEFFETRRGRLRAFWHIDQDQYMQPIDIDISGNFVSVREADLDLADTQEEFQGEAVGVVMSDGQHLVRPVSTLLSVLTVFRISVSDPFPTGLLIGDVHRVARARLVRFAKDEFTETWTNTGHMGATINVIEVLNEQDFEI
jgi:hypothetical protein